MLCEMRVEELAGTGLVERKARRELVRIREYPPQPVGSCGGGLRETCPCHCGSQERRVDMRAQQVWRVVREVGKWRRLKWHSRILGDADRSRGCVVWGIHEA